MSYWEFPILYKKFDFVAGGKGKKVEEIAVVGGVVSRRIVFILFPFL